MEPISLPDLAKSYGRRASHNEEITFWTDWWNLGGEKSQTQGY